MRAILRVAVALACFAVVNHASTVSAQSQTKTTAGSRAFTNGYNVPSNGVAIEGYCPVCYLSANKAVKGKPEFSYDYKGVTYYFVHDGARQTFIANPEKFLPAYGGWCAVGVSMGQRFPVDPTNFKIVDGRIMLFLKNAKVDAVQLWNKNEASNLTQADENWKKLGS